MDQIMAVVQMVVTVLTLIVAAFSAYLTKKANNDNNLAQISTLQRRDRMNGLQGCVADILHYSDPDYIRVCSEDEQKAAYASVSESVSSLEAMLHCTFENDAELIGLGKYIKKMVYFLITDTAKRNNDGFIKHFGIIRNIFSVQADRYTYSDWERIKEEIRGELTKSRVWLDIYNALGEKFTNIYVALGIAADFHCHTQESDGMYTSEQVIDLAVGNRLNCISIADHDTLASQQAAIEYSRDKLIYIPALEISCKTIQFTAGCEYSLHMLGYGIDILNLDLNANLAKMAERREMVYGELLRKLSDFGYLLCGHTVSAKHGKMLQLSDYRMKLYDLYPSAKEDRRVFQLMEEISSKLDDIMPSPEEAIRWIRNANGVPVWAHPLKVYKNGKKVAVLKAHVAIMAEKLNASGLRGMEVYYLEHTDDEAAFLRNVAKKHRFLLSCGSDFHGSSGRDRMIASSCLGIEPMLSLAVSKMGQNDCG